MLSERDFPSISGITPQDPKGFLFKFAGPLVWQNLLAPLFTPVQMTRNEYTTATTPYPPLLVRELLSTEAVRSLRQACNIANKAYPGLFDHFDIHSRGLFLVDGEQDSLVLPWDVYTYVELGDICVSGPINVSLSHWVMRAKWHEDPAVDLYIKRGILETQLLDITQHQDGGPMIDIHCISFPSKFAKGATHKIFTEYPHTFPPPSFSPNHTRCAVQAITTSLGEETLYVFPGKRINDTTFQEVIRSAPFLFYCKLMSYYWNKDFSTHLTQRTPETVRFVETDLPAIMRSLGALSVN